MKQIVCVLWIVLASRKKKSIFASRVERGRKFHYLKHICVCWREALVGLSLRNVDLSVFFSHRPHLLIQKICAAEPPAL